MIDEYFSAAFVAEGLANELEFLADHFEQPLGAGKNVRQVANLFQ